MLLRFGIENCYSFKEYQEFSMVASAMKDPAADLIETPGMKERILPAAALYGANASGKSNLLAAWNTLRYTILGSHGYSRAKEGIPRFPFLLDTQAKGRPSRLDCDVIIDGIRHQFGFAVNNERVLEEWLYVYPHGRPQKWYHRRHGEEPEYEFGNHLKGQKGTLSEFTKPNSLFLSTAAANNHDQLAKVRKYFQNDHTNIDETLTSKPFFEVTDKLIADQEERERYIRFLDWADTGITSMQIEEISASELAKRGLSEYLEFINGTSVHDVKLGHRSLAGDPVFLPLGMESRGTITLSSLLPSVFKTLDNGGVLWVDELSANMHPLLARRLVALFNSREINDKGAQLIFTTHDTNMLGGGLLRRDQVWFAEKDQGGASHLYPLTDCAPRPGENMEHGYLQGRYGAIPILGSLSSLFPPSGTGAGSEQETPGKQSKKEEGATGEEGQAGGGL